jgi:glycosyltransferase involved in cell wall biosynthesis
VNLCWFVPNDEGGGVISVAVSCCRQAVQAGHDVTLLLIQPSTGWIDEYATFRHEALGRTKDSRDIPRRLVEWLQENPQDVLFLNDCGPAHVALPYLPADVRSVMVIHDTARQYWRPAVQYESVLDGITTVSNVVARRFRHRLDQPSQLNVLHNGTVFPTERGQTSEKRADDLLFLGGDKPYKGAEDVLALWPELLKRGFEGKLHWYGAIQPSFQRKIDGLPRTDRIEIHGRVPRSNIFSRAGRAKVLLMLSRADAFGMVTIEGMGMGTLPVAWDIETGTKEIVEPGTTGFFAPLGDTKTLADQVITACRQHRLHYDDALGVARARFSEEAMWDRYSEFLDALQKWPAVNRPKAGQTPPQHEPPTRYFQLLPSGIRDAMRSVIARSPTLSYWLRDFRGL